MKIGCNYNSYVYKYINEINPVTNSKNYNIRENLKIYEDFNNMIDDFRMKKIEIILLNRSEYYKLYKKLPLSFLLYIDIGKTFGYFYFYDKNLLTEFNKFNEKKDSKYDWIEFF